MCGKKYVRGAWIGLMAAAFAVSCGSNPSSNTPTTPPPTGISKRVLVSNTSTGVVTLLDANRDALSAKTFSANSPTKMVTSGGTTIVQNISAGQISIIDNKTEVVTFTALLADIPFDIAISPDGKTAWAAVRSQSLVQQVDVATGNITKSVTVPSASRLVMSPTGTKLLAFSDDPQSAPTNANSFFVIDTAAPPASGTPIAMTAGDQPFTGVFAGSETQVFILNCGTECGGANAPSVVRVDLSGATPNASVAGTINGATVGLFDSGKLYVAGTKLATLTTPVAGGLQVIDAASLTAGPVIPISDGRHTIMALSTNKHLYVGAAGCTPGPVNAQSQARGCLSIFNTAAAAGATNPVFPLQSSLRQNFNVTAFQQISNRNVMYVCQGAELDFFDITTDAVSTTIQIVDLVGKAYGLVQLDP